MSRGKNQKIELHSCQIESKQKWIHSPTQMAFINWSWMAYQPPQLLSRRHTPIIQRSFLYLTDTILFLLLVSRPISQMCVRLRGQTYHPRRRPPPPNDPSYFSFYFRLFECLASSPCRMLHDGVSHVNLQHYFLCLTPRIASYNTFNQPTNLPPTQLDKSTSKQWQRSQPLTLHHHHHHHHHYHSHDCEIHSLYLWNCTESRRPPGR